MIRLTTHQLMRAYDLIPPTGDVVEIEHRLAPGRDAQGNISTPPGIYARPAGATAWKWLGDASADAQAAA